MITRMNEDSGGVETIVRYMKVRNITAFCLEGMGHIYIYMYVCIYMTHNKPSNSRLCSPCDVIAQNYKQI